MGRCRGLAPCQDHGAGMPANPGQFPGRGAAVAGRALVPPRVFVQFRGQCRSRVRLHRRAGGAGGRCANPVLRREMMIQNTTLSPRFCVGLDLGQSADPSAWAVLEQSQYSDPESRASYACRHLQRWPLGTPYPTIVEEVGRLVATPPLPNCTLVVDATGCGRPVVDMIRQARPPADLVPVPITAGHALTCGPDGYHVPKRELVSTLQILLQERRLQIARALPEAAKLERELLSFQMRITPSAHEAFGAWREDAHDDLVIALALAS